MLVVSVKWYRKRIRTSALFETAGDKFWCIALQGLEEELVAQSRQLQQQREQLREAAKAAAAADAAAKQAAEQRAVLEVEQGNLRKQLQTMQVGMESTLPPSGFLTHPQRCIIRRGLNPRERQKHVFLAESVTFQEPQDLRRAAVCQRSVWRTLPVCWTLKTCGHREAWPSANRGSQRLRPG